MSIHRKIIVINRLEEMIKTIKKKVIVDDLDKLEKSLKELKNYLNNLDHLKPNYTTNEINHFFTAINVDLALLKTKLPKQDYRKINNGITVLKTLLRLHPMRYSFIEYTILWFYELIYFI